ncbi:MAG: 5'-deoxynucleotidase [Clostridiales bacterium]|jgi:5'-deoxynucleotidase|nr:5'-deoxynucleotidase [Clostridiales bacterium]
MAPYHFFAYLSRMKLIRRWGLMRNLIPENDMEHAMQAAMIAHAIAVIGNTRYQRSYNAEHVMAMALFHDISEVITGDLPTPVKHNNPQIKAEYHKIERIAVQRLKQMLPLDLQPVYEPFIIPNGDSEEWRLVKAADRICGYIKCLEETKAGNNEFLEARDAIHATLMAIDLPEVQDFIRDFVPGFGMSLDQISR